MKNKILLTIAILFCTTTYAQEDSYGRFDMEGGFQIPILGATIAGSDYSISNYAFFEGRWQLKKLPINIGFNFSCTEVSQDNGYTYDNYYSAIPILAVTDYQFGRGKDVNPYVGMGVGVSINQLNDNSSEVHFAATPRFGIRFFKFINLQLGYLITHRDYSRMYVNIGFYF